MISVIDIGSNSVRIMYSDGNRTLGKEVITTRLAEGMSTDLCLKAEAMKRTAKALSFFYQEAKAKGVERIYVFATAAVRKARNKQEFLDLVYSLSGINIDVISGEKESEIGYLGALDGADGGLIDVGGASTEVIVVEKGKSIYSKSLDIGAVTLKDTCGQDIQAVDNFLNDKILEYCVIPFSNKFYSIGGTATSTASMLLELEAYSPEKVDGFIVNKEQLKKLKDKLFAMSVEERKNVVGLQRDRAEVIAHGVAILYAVIEKIGINEIIISEKDNLEGYLKIKMVD